MSHEQRQRATEPSSPDYYAPPCYPLSPSEPADEAGKPPMHDHKTLTPFRKWAARAGDSQFNAIAGAVGGFTSGIVTCPLDVIKTKLQAQGAYHPVDLGRHAGHPKMYNGLVGTAKVIWREEGIRGMYRGLGPIVMGYLPTWAVWFTVYNEAKTWLGQYQGECSLFCWKYHMCIADGMQQTILMLSTFGPQLWQVGVARL